MKVIIFAGGRGTRMGELTRGIPKPLLNINNKPILSYILESLPSAVTEIIVVINYCGDKIQNYFGDSFNNIPIKYISQDINMLGTGGALWSVRHLIENGEKFLVLNGDDIYTASFLNNMIQESLAFGVAYREWDDYLAVLVDEAGNMSDFIPQKGAKLVSTGAYTLDNRIFTYEPRLLANKEYGLPRVVLAMAKDYPVKVVRDDHFLPINTPEDLKKAESVICA